MEEKLEINDPIRKDIELESGLKTNEDDQIINNPYRPMALFRDKINPTYEKVDASAELPLDWKRFKNYLSMLGLPILFFRKYYFI